MSNMTPEQVELSQAWASIHKGAGMALDWVAEVAPKAGEVEANAPALSRDLHRARNLARSLGRVSATPMGIGFFGLSQAGKSYLISALAADQEGKLETEFGHHTLDFMKHVNPVGGGKEATGLVTRFTRRATPSPDPNFPVEIRLFREIEIVCILTNAWFEDFDHDRLDSEITASKVDAILRRFDNHTGTSTAGVDRDDIVALWDYLEHNFYKRVSPLAARYWPRVLELAPQLSVRERAELFSILWGGSAEISAAYEQLASALHRMSLAETVFAPLSSLVTEHDGALVASNSIMNVETLYLLGSGNDPRLEVRPRLNGELCPPVAVSVAELAALTNELIFRLIHEPANQIVNSVDLFDFPGYRTRGTVQNISRDVGASNSLPTLLLRGKVAYLFERYTNEQEMNALVMCTNSDKQSEVVGVDKVLKTWISKTQGATAQQRDARPCGLIWAFTMCDMFIGTALGNDASRFPESCYNLMKRTILERFGDEDWMKLWGAKPFNNTYLVRKPGIEMPFIDQDTNRREVGIASSKLDAISALRQSFLDNENVKRHIAEPDEAWDAVLLPNDGGMARFSSSFLPVAALNFKLDRIREQLAEVMTQLLPRLEEYYEAGGEDERAKKKLLANMIVKPFAATKHGRYILGDLLAYMSIPEEQLRELYLSGDFESAEQQGDDSQSAQVAVPEIEYDIWSGAITPTEQISPATVVPEYQSHEHRFARAAFELWVTHLRGLSRRQYLLDTLDLPAEAISLLIKELVVCAERLELPAQLAKSLLKRAQSGVRRESLVQRQVMTTQLLLNDFSAWFGHMSQPPEQRPSGLLGSKLPLFAFYDQAMPGRFPELLPQAADQSAIFANDWISGVAIHTQNNAGHRKGKEITPEQNEALGQVIQAFNAR